MICQQNPEVVQNRWWCIETLRVLRDFFYRDIVCNVGFFAEFGGFCGLEVDFFCLAQLLLIEKRELVCRYGVFMSNDINIISSLEAGIRAEGLRQRAIANNIANMNTPGFRRSDIHFEEIFAKALETGHLDANDLEAALHQPKSTPIKSNGNDVSLDVEVGSMVKNTLKHKTYMLLLKKKYQQFNAAMRTQ